MILQKLFIADLKLLVRNRQLLFWSLAFPLLFTVIFGFFYGGGHSGVGTVALVQESHTTLAQSLVDGLKKIDGVTVKTADTVDQGKDMVKKNQAVAVVEVPDHFGEMTATASKQVVLYSDPSGLQASAVIASYLGEFTTTANYQTLQVQPVFSLRQERASSANYGYFDYVLVGLIGMALMNSAIQGIAIAMSQYREDQILKRITTTPIPSWQFIVAEVLSRLVLNLVQVGVILIVGVRFFDAKLSGSIPLVFAIALLGAVLFQLIGFFIAAVSKTTQGAEGMSTAVTIPMMFLAGVFFPIDQLPKWLYSIVQYLPLAPLLRMLRTVALDSGSMFDNPLNIAIVLGWIALMLAVTVYRFRLTEE